MTWNYEASYANHLGQRVEFGDSTGIYLDEGGLFGYAWDASYTAKRITGATRAVREVEASLLHLSTVSPESAEDFYRVIDADAFAGLAGTLTVNGFSMQGMFTQSEPDEYWHKKGMMRRKCVFLCESAHWVRPTLYRFAIQRNLYEPRKTVGETPEAASRGLAFPHGYPFGYGGAGGELPNVGWPYALDYRYGYPYDYTRWDRAALGVSNGSFAPATLLIRVYGPAMTPAVTVGGNRYEVSVNVPDGYRLLIDGARRAVELVDPYGNAADAFGRRLKGMKGSGSYIFEELQPGSAAVSWDNTFAFDIEVQERRSAPPIWR